MINNCLNDNEVPVEMKSVFIALVIIYFFDDV